MSLEATLAHVEKLTGEIVDTTQEHQCQLLRVRVNCFQEVLFPDNTLAVTGTDFDDRIIRIKTMKLRLRLQQVSI